MGLAIVQKIVSRANGQVHAEKDAQGFRICVDLPAHDQNAVAFG